MQTEINYYKIIADKEGFEIKNEVEAKHSIVMRNYFKNLFIVLCILGALHILTFLWALRIKSDFFLMIVASVVVLISIILLKAVIHLPKKYSESDAISDKARKYFMQTKNIPGNAHVIKYKNGIAGFINPKTLYFWVDKEKDQVCFADYDIKANKGLFCYSFCSIKSFQIIGDMYVEQNISGGGGGGSSLGGAVAGGLIAGAPGAIIASRKEIEEIRTENKVIDKRDVVLEVTKDGQSEYLFFHPDVHKVFLKAMPGKELNFVLRQESANTQTPKNDIYESIKALSKLKEEGLLSNEEFRKKKAEILERL